VDSAAKAATTKVLLHPTSSRAVVTSSNSIATGIIGFQGALGIESSPESLEAKRWADAAGEVRDKVFETGADGVDAAGRVGAETFDLAKSATDKFSRGMAERAVRLRRGIEDRNSKGSRELE
jgi:hypothetical protein